MGEAYARNMGVNVGRFLVQLDPAFQCAVGLRNGFLPGRSPLWALPCCT